MAALALLLLTIFTTFGVVFIKMHDQAFKDRNRRTYRLSFPQDLNAEQVTAWVRSISGTLRAGRTSLAGSPSLVFELLATSGSIQHRLRVPWQYADFVVGQLQGFIPGIRITPEDEFLRPIWTKAAEVSMTHSSRPLRIYDPGATAISLLKSVEALTEGEAVIVQWVVTPAVPQHPPVYQQAKTDYPRLHNLVYGTQADRDEVTERRQKQAEPNVLAALRVASRASTVERSKHLINRVRQALASTRTHATRFRKRLASTKALQQRIDTASGAVIFPIQLSAPELTALLGWPIGSPNVAGLPAPAGKQLPPAPSIPSEGIVIGHATFPGAERPVAIGYDEALMHTWVGGSTGTGKSVVLANMARQMMEQGYGLIVIETEGNLYQSVLDYVPAERIDDVVLMDVADSEHPVGFNVLDQADPSVVIDQLIDLFNHKYQTSMWAEEQLYFGLRTIAATPGLSLTDLQALLTPQPDEKPWALDVQRSLADPELRRWWERQNNRNAKQQQQRAEPVLSRIWHLASRSDLRNVMGQSQSTFKVSDIMRDNRILLVNLKGVSRETASLAGTLLVNAIWHATRTTQRDKPTFVLMDEFADMMDLPIATESMLAQARKHKVGLVLANQHLAQLKKEVQDAVLANARNKIVLTTNAEDGRHLSRHMGGGLEVHDFTSLQQYEAWAQVLTPTGISKPASIRTAAPTRSQGNAREVVKASRLRYARARAEVAAEIENRRDLSGGAKRERPSIGSDAAWG